MKVYFYGFWGNIFDENKKNNNKYFIDLLSKVFKNQSIEISTDMNDSDILFESVFSQDTKLYDKKWKYSFLFSGESDRRVWNSIIPGSQRIHTLKDYDCILKGEHSKNNIINLPLFVYYSYSFDFNSYFLLPHKNITKIPPKNVCVIVSNGHDSEGRNYFFNILEQIIPIDYAGEYKNNVPKINAFHCTEEFIDFVSQYKFIITMENSKNKTYITEKILHGFCANTIPVYWGSDYITEYFNEERFINVENFQQETIIKAINKMISLINDPSAYLEMVNKPIYKNNRNPFPIEKLTEEIQELLKITPITPNTPNIIKKKFITFGGPTQRFHNTVIRICEEARQLDFFDEIQGFTEQDLIKDQEFWQQNGQFIIHNARGFGYWIWKSHIINKELEKMNEGDILIYADAGCEINKNGKKRFMEYIDMLHNNVYNYGLISFVLPFQERQFTKKMIFEYFQHVENYTNIEELKDKKQCMATVIIIKKNKHSSHIIKKWSEITKYHLLINDIITNNEDEIFKENRHDQSIYSILVNNYGSIKIKDETYFDNWDNGEHYPILAKRNK